MKHDPFIGKTLDGKFQLTEVIGRGGMGVVYRGRQLSMGGRPVAVKVLKAEKARDARAVNRFRKEIEAVGRLSHPNAVIVYDCGQTEDGIFYIVMEILSGSPLSKVIKAEAPLSLARAVGILSQVCDALAQAHQSGVIHRDLKPANIYLVDTVAGQDVVKVLDFGIAKVMAPPGDLTPTETGRILGTAGYISPELVRSEQPDPRADLYAMGVIFFEMLCGRRPYRGDNPIATIMMHVDAEIPSVAELLGESRAATAIDRFLRRALAKDPADRPAGALAFKEELLLCRVAAGPLADQPFFNPGDEPEITSTAPGETLTLARRHSREADAEVSVTQRLPLPSRPGRTLVPWVLGALLSLALVGVLALLSLRPSSTDRSAAPDAALAVTAAPDAALTALAATTGPPAATTGSPEATPPVPDATPPVPDATQPASDATPPAPKPVAGDDGEPALAVEDVDAAALDHPRPRSARVQTPPAPLDATALYSRGNRFILKHRYERAIESFKATLEVDPGFADAHRGLGICYARLGDHARSVRSYERYLKARPTAQDAAAVRELVRRYTELRGEPPE